MVEIANLIERGHDFAHKVHRKTSDEQIQAKAEGHLQAKDQNSEERLLDEAAERAIRQEDEVRSPRHVPDERMPEDEPQRVEESKSGQAGSQPPRQLSAAFLGGSRRGQRPGRAIRRTTLTPEEKYARDAWCRKERRDVDDDEVKAWVSGKHLVIESKKGEDVRIVDANPDKIAREKARRDPDLNLRGVDISEFIRAKGKIFAENPGASPSNTEGLHESNGSGRAAQAKRFDLRTIADRSSFRRFLGKGTEGDDNISPTLSSPPRVIPVSEEESDDRTGRLRFAEGTQPPSRRVSPNRSNAAVRGDGGTDNSNHLSTRKTGIPLLTTETTDSQVRFATLPEPRRK